MRAASCLAIVGVLALACGCARVGTGPGGASPVDRDPTGAWLLDSGSGPLGPIRVPAGWKVSLTFEGDQAYGQACNSYGGHYDLDGDAIHFSAMTMTEMACEEPMMDVESAYHQALAAVDSWGRKANGLVLRGAAVELVFVPMPPVANAALQDTHWILDSLVSGEVASSVQGVAWLELRADGTLAGSTGCRDLSGQYALDGQRVTVNGLRSTLVSPCPSGLAAQDAQVMRVLEHGFAAAVDGPRLVLTGADGSGLGYLAPSPD